MIKMILNKIKVIGLAAKTQNTATLTNVWFSVTSSEIYLFKGENLKPLF